MKVELDAPLADPEPRRWVEREQVLAMALSSGSIVVGARRSEMKRLNYQVGELGLCPRDTEIWFQDDGMQRLSLSISDSVLAAAAESPHRGVELCRTSKLEDARLAALAAAVNAERIAGFPSGRLFLDHVEQAIAVALVRDYGVKPATPRVYRGGLSPARLRRVTELVNSKIDADLSLEEMAQSVNLSVTHFCQMFRKSTGQSPHQFLLRHRVECAKAMLRSAETRVLDVAIACGFKTQQHFARVFRSVCGASPNEYRQELGN